MARWPNGVGPAANRSLLGGARVSPGQGEAGFANKTVSRSKP
ncbi:MAG: hypothetical protein NTY36_04665 [Deltaproteobacteria bacterium]|nr:hypothetical protein [Deltaproteobacteria bacterium]